MVRARRVVGLGILAVLLVGCGGAPSASKPSSGTTPLPATGNLATRTSPAPTPMGELVQIGGVTYANWGERDAKGEKTRDLSAGDFYFKGTFIQGEPGQKLTLAFNNTADQVHNFSLPAQGLDRDIPPGTARVNIDVTFPASGGVPFFCKFHAAQGMNGLLLIGELPPPTGASPSPSPVSSPQRPG